MTHQLSSKIIYPEITVNRKPPLNLKPGDEKYFRHEYQKIFPPVRLWNFKNVNVTNEGIIFRGSKIFKQNLITAEYSNKYKIYKYLLAKYIKNKKIILNNDETYLLVYDSWSAGYFHWMCDVLPRLLSIKSILPECILLLPENYTESFISESLKIIGCNNIKIIPKNFCVKVPNLIVPEHIAPTGNYNPNVMAQLQNVFLGINTAQAKKDSGKNIYVSRKKALYKKIINQEEVEIILKKYDFETIFFEDFSLKEQIEIASNAKFMIGLHGANMTNVLFMQPQSYILEFRKENDERNNAYYSLANSIGIHYLYQFCKFDNTKYNHPNRFDIWVDIKCLENNLQFVLQ